MLGDSKVQLGYLYCDRGMGRLPVQQFHALLRLDAQRDLVGADLVRNVPATEEETHRQTDRPSRPPNHRESFELWAFSTGYI